MRLKRNRLREFKHFQVVQKKDAEGGTYTEYAPPSCFRAEMWTAGGKVQAEMYGSRLGLVRTLCQDTPDPSGLKHKVMRYEAIIDMESEEVFWPN